MSSSGTDLNQWTAWQLLKKDILKPERIAGSSEEQKDSLKRTVHFWFLLMQEENIADNMRGLQGPL